MAADVTLPPTVRRSEPRVAIGWRDVTDLIPASWQLLRAQHALQTAERGALLALAASVPASAVDRTRLAEAERLGRAVSRAARRGPVRAKCLASSLALQRWLVARGITGGVVRIGVRQSPGGIEAHAWVTYGHTVLGDSEGHVRSFTPIAASAAAGLAW